jgi:hypothetical protein
MWPGHDRFLKFSPLLYSFFGATAIAGPWMLFAVLFTPTRHPVLLGLLSVGWVVTALVSWPRVRRSRRELVARESQAGGVVSEGSVG